MTKRIGWNPRTWENHTAHQLPVYPDEAELQRVIEQLEQRPALVHPSEIIKLKQGIGEAGKGNRFIVHAGECAERFIDCQSETITEKMRILLQLSLLALHGLKKPVLALGRIAGQFGKPRSEDFETRGELSLPSYRGDIINGFEFSPAARRPDPHRMLDAYQCACATMNWMRALGECGLSEITSLRRWGLSGHRQPSRVLAEVSEKLEETISLLANWSGNSSLSAFLARHPVFTSHEALLLPYEAALSRFSEDYDSYFNLGAHFLWLGERTKQIDGAHVEYLRGIGNPVGIKVGPATQPEELCTLIRTLNPSNEWGKICVITRLGHQRVAELLPNLISAVGRESLNVTWSCDPMHGNIVRMSDGIKTRYFDSIRAEVVQSQSIHQNMGTWLGGVHLEITAEDVTECVGGEIGVRESQLGLNYQSYCDPRLNYAQSLELMNHICEEHQRSVQREVAGATQVTLHQSDDSPHRFSL